MPPAAAISATAAIPATEAPVLGRDLPRLAAFCSTFGAIDLAAFGGTGFPAFDIGGTGFDGSATGFEGSATGFEGVVEGVTEGVTVAEGVDGTDGVGDGVSEGVVDGDGVVEGDGEGVGLV